MITILFFGDVVGRAGRRAVAEALPVLKRKTHADVVIVNGENSTHGNGITAKTYTELRAAGADLITLGDHAFDREEAKTLLVAEAAHLIRPANYPPGTPGVGAQLIPLGTRRLRVGNLLGRVFMKIDTDCPFRTFDAVLKQYAGQRLAGVVVDFHAEATSEKQAFGWYADGRAAAVLGTHTHVPTADARILPRGTAVVADVGMVGPRDSVIGVSAAASLKGFLQQTPVLLEPADGPCVVGAVAVTIDPESGRAHAVTRVDIEVAAS
ncbi:MAG: TIGR00282 family metallophosphoesterase [Patescibacteria group bacterium]